MCKNMGPRWVKKLVTLSLYKQVLFTALSVKYTLAARSGQFLLSPDRGRLILLDIFCSSIRMVGACSKRPEEGVVDSLPGSYLVLKVPNCRS